MKIISVNIAKKEPISWQGKTWKTGIFKKEQSHFIAITKTGVYNDTVVDKKHHGGEHMAVYGFSKNHYAFFKNHYPNIAFYNGIFGENLTVENLDETKIKIGDTFKIGSAILQVSQPRLPCKTLNAVFKSDNIIKLFLNSTFSGAYFRVLKEGKIYKNDKVFLLDRANNSATLSEVFSLFTKNKKNTVLIERVLKIDTLSPKIKMDIKRKLL